MKYANLYENILLFQKNTTFAPTYLKDIHNKDYSEGVNIQSGTQVPLFCFCEVSFRKADLPLRRYNKAATDGSYR